MRRAAALSAALVAAAAAAAPAFADSSDEAWPGLIVPSGFVLFYDTTGTLSYPSASRLPPQAEPLGKVKGRGCQYMLSVPLSLALRSNSASGAAGRGGYDAAFKDIRKAHPELRGIYDVKVDDHELSILGVFTRVCTEVTAFGFK
jgi:hypothetical protein